MSSAPITNLSLGCLYSATYTASLLFVKASKILAASFTVGPLSGCAIATGLIYGCFLIAVSYAPDRYTSFFSVTLLAFALVETFCFMTMGLVAYLLFV